MMLCFILIYLTVSLSLKMIREEDSKALLLVYNLKHTLRSVKPIPPVNCLLQLLQVGVVLFSHRFLRHVLSGTGM